MFLRMLYFLYSKQLERMLHSTLTYVAYTVFPMQFPFRARADDIVQQQAVQRLYILFNCVFSELIQLSGVMVSSQIVGKLHSDGNHYSTSEAVYLSKWIFHSSCSVPECCLIQMSYSLYSRPLKHYYCKMSLCLKYKFFVLSVTASKQIFCIGLCNFAWCGVPMCNTKIQLFMLLSNEYDLFIYFYNIDDIVV